MFRLVLFCLLLAISAETEPNSKIYKVVKPDGTVLYTDKPQPGAELVEISIPQTVTPALAPPTPRPLKKPEAVNRQADYVAPELAIKSPKDGETVRSNSGDVTVVGSTNKAVTGKYQLVLNGEVTGENKLPEFHLTLVPRGTHRIQIKLVNKGKQLASSDIVTFYLHQASVNNR